MLIIIELVETGTIILQIIKSNFHFTDQSHRKKTAYRNWTFPIDFLTCRLHVHDQQSSTKN